MTIKFRCTTCEFLNRQNRRVNRVEFYSLTTAVEHVNNEPAHEVIAVLVDASEDQ